MRLSLKKCSGLVVLGLALAACDSTPGPQSTAAVGFVCAPRAAGAADLSGEWQTFAADIDECSLRGADGAVAVRVVAVSAKKFYARQPDGAPTVGMPKPLIVSATGKTIGRLPYNYPDDPPFASALNFEDWRDGLPRRIRIAVTDPTVSGDHELAMTWDESKGEYVGGEEKQSR